METVKLKALSDQEQLEAKIEFAHRKFAEDMRKIDEVHVRNLRRMNWWEAFAQGVVWGAAGVSLIVMLMALLKHK